MNSKVWIILPNSLLILLLVVYLFTLREIGKRFGIINETLASIQHMNVYMDSHLKDELHHTNTDVNMIKASLERDNLLLQKILTVRKIIGDETTRTSVKLSISERNEIAKAVVKYSEEWELKPWILMGLLKAESAFNPKAVSHRGAQGIAQVMPLTAENIRDWLNIKMKYRWYNPRHNIQFGAYYLSRMLDTFDNKLELAIAAYNAGPTRVEQYRNYERCMDSLNAECGKPITLPDETVQYVENVLRFAEEFKKMGVI